MDISLFSKIAESLHLGKITPPECNAWWRVAQSLARLKDLTGKTEQALSEAKEALQLLKDSLKPGAA